MGISTNSRVAFICSQDETEWIQPFIDVMKTPTKQSALGYETNDVMGAGYWEKEDRMGVPIAEVEVRNGGRVIVVGSDYYGLIGPARMDLPKSLQAVVCSSWSCQSELQDPIFAVLAENVRLHDFDDENPVVKPLWFDYDSKRDLLYNAVDENNWDEEKQEEIKDVSASYELIEKTLVEQRAAGFEQLIKEVAARTDMDMPFLDGRQIADVREYLVATNHPESDPEDWMTGYPDLPLVPSWEYTNTEVIGLSTEQNAVGNGFPPELQKLAEESLKAAADAEAARLERMKAFEPSKPGMSRAEYAAAFEAAIAGGEDVTGAFNAIQALHLPENANRNLKGYTLARIKSETSPVGNKLIAATKGEDVHQLIQGLFQSGKYNSFDSETKTEPVASDVAIIEDEKEAAEENGYNLLLLITDEDYAQFIEGDPTEEREWEAVLDASSSTQYWRYLPGKPLLKENGERFGVNEYAELYGFDLSVVGFYECALSPKWADGFDYYPLWEMALGAGSIDEEIDVDELSAMIKAGRYFAGDHGGYLVVDTADAGTISPAKPKVLAPLTGEELTDKLLELKKVGIDSNQEILKATGYWNGDSETYSQANMDFYSAKLTAEKADGSWARKQSSFEVVDAAADGEGDVEAIIENIDTAGEPVDAFCRALGQYVLHQEFTNEVLKLFKEIYSTTNAEELDIEEMPSEEAFISIAKRAVLERIETENDYDINDPYFLFEHLYWAIEGTPEEKAEGMYEFVLRNPQAENLPRRFAVFMLKSTESGMGGSNYLSLKEPFWSIIKHHIIGNKNVPNPFYSGGDDINEIICSDWDDNIAALLENPEVIKVFGKHGIRIIPREGKQVKTSGGITFSGKRVCVTGKLSQTRKEIEAALEAAGATIASGVSKTTDILIVGEDAGNKLSKAKELGITVLTEDEMNATLEA